ncbi:MAG: hypothetical protein PHN57_06165 [Candidatus Omnitrophica bacterium]|nr:hypothetical protein [Candidatus Omnitrophota bacterium]
MPENNNNNNKRNSIICIRVNSDLKDKFEQLAEEHDESASAIARKCLNCFMKNNFPCEVRKRYFKI